MTAQTPEQLMVDRVRRLANEMDNVAQVLRMWVHIQGARRTSLRIHDTAMFVQRWTKEAR